MARVCPPWDPVPPPLVLTVARFIGLRYVVCGSWDRDAPGMWSCDRDAPGMWSILLICGSCDVAAPVITEPLIIITEFW